MAHWEQEEFCKSVVEKFPKFFTGKKVLDAGSLDINGSTRYLFTDCEYVGLDLAEGPNVDIVSTIHEFNVPNNSFDVVISTECFEHDMYWNKSLPNITRLLKPNGMFIFTCATTGRPEHGTRRSEPEAAPFLPTREETQWQDYYKNLTEEDIRSAINVDNIFSSYEFSTVGCDLYFWGIKRKQKVLVIGDSCLDNFIYGTCDRVCPEAPVPVFKTSKTEVTNGMAKNVAHNLDVLGISNDCITNKEKIIKNRYVDTKSGQLVLRVDEFDSCPPIESNFFMTINWAEYDLVVISDYCKGFLSEKDIVTICQHHSTVFLDTKKILGDWVLNVSALKINETEYNTNKKYLDEYFPKDKLIITLGEKGCNYNNEIYPVEAQEVKNSSGAGDAFLAGLIKGHLRTKDLKKDIRYALKSASKVVKTLKIGL